MDVYQQAYNNLIALPEERALNYLLKITSVVLTSGEYPIPSGHNLATILKQDSSNRRLWNYEAGKGSISLSDWDMSCNGSHRRYEEELESLDPTKMISTFFDLLFSDLSIELPEKDVPPPQGYQILHPEDGLYKLVQTRKNGKERAHLAQWAAIETTSESDRRYTTDTSRFLFIVSDPYTHFASDYTSSPEFGGEMSALTKKVDSAMYIYGLLKMIHRTTDYNARKKLIKELEEPLRLFLNPDSIW